MRPLYSMCWEDYTLISKALKITKDDSILCIASAGENLFSLVLKNPKKLIGIDNNSAQINLVKLKMAAIRSLSFEEFVKFIGLLKCNDRRSLFRKCIPFLDMKSKRFWLENSRLIEKGIIHSGKFENYLRIFRNTILKLSISKEKIRDYLSLRKLEEQKSFYEKYWNHFFWRTSFKIFFSKFLMKRLGRKKEFFRFNQKQSITNYFFKKTEHGITEIPAKENPFINYILTGSVPIPIKNHPYLDKGNFTKLKKLLKNIELIESDISFFILSKKNLPFNKYCLSDVFETMSQEKYEKIISSIAEKSKSETIICYWNNLVKRNSHPNVKTLIKNKISKKLFSKDRVFFYSDFIIEKSISKA